MFIRLLIAHLFFLTIIAQSTVTNSSKGQSSTSSPILPKSGSLDDDYDLNDQTTVSEGSGGSANLDEYADEEEDNEQLSKITATTMMSSTTTTTTTKRTTMKLPEQKNSTKTPDLDTDEFNEDYKDDLETDVDYNEMTTKISSISLSTTRPSSSSTPSYVSTQRTPIRALLKFLTRPPIAAGILVGLAIGILTSVILLICLIQRFHKRQRTHSSYTTGLLYPNQYGYSKSPQEFYA